MFTDLRSPSRRSMSSTRPGRGRPVVAALILALTAAACGGGGHDAAARSAPAAPHSSAVKPEQVTSTIPPSTTTTTTAPTTTTAAPTTTTTTTRPPEPRDLPPEPGALAAGSKGPRTIALQERLKVLKYDPGPVDGRFGLKTTMAVWAFEALHGLPQDGTVSPALAQQILTAAPEKMRRPELGPTHSEVDLTGQTLIVFHDGAPALVTHVSTGHGRHYCDNGHCGTAVTPTGTYHYNRRIAGWRDGPLGRLYNPVYFNGGIAVHGAPSVPASPASHGCVRIPMHIAQYFPSLVANGEPISVYRAA
jgi:peptidoglycan hydrolase-like protein with peptidoglycan-binding domain